MTLARSRPSMVFVTWTSRSGRAAEIAAAFDGEALSVAPLRGLPRAFAPLRYGVSAVMTAVALVRVRPRAVIVTNPPVFAGLTVAIYCALTSTPFALDSHPTAFGAKNYRLGALLLPLSKALIRRAEVVLVTTDTWVARVGEWSGRALIVHEADTAKTVTPVSAISDRACIAYVGIFGGDEPIDEVIDAAAMAPELDVVITGDLRRAPADLATRAPRNVTFSGYLDGHDYEQLLARAHVVCALTTEPTSVMRAAYEATYAERPLVISDEDASMQYFPQAVHVANTAQAIAAGWREAVLRHDELRDTASLARAEQQARWEEQRIALATALGLVSS